MPPQTSPAICASVHAASPPWSPLLDGAGAGTQTGAEVGESGTSFDKHAISDRESLNDMMSRSSRRYSTSVPAVVTRAPDCATNRSATCAGVTFFAAAMRWTSGQLSAGLPAAPSTE